jgi:two-component system sensor kinase FixL
MHAEMVSKLVTPEPWSARPSRRFGVEGLCDLPWGAHFCLFYSSLDEYLDIVAPYFAAGLAANERGIWIASPPLTVAAAKARLATLVSDLDACIATGRIEILSCDEWYLRTGEIDGNRLIEDWKEKHDTALLRGFEGLRGAGNVFEFREDVWPAFMSYEADLGAVHGSRRMLTLCAYPLHSCGAAELLDVIARHEFALIRRGARWETIKSLDTDRARKALRQSEERFRLLAEGAPASAIFTLDASGRVVSWSDGAERLTGWTSDDVIGRRMSVLRPTDRPDETLRADLETAAEHGLVKRCDARLRRDGSAFPAEELVAALRDDTNDIYGYAVMITDLSERTRAEQERIASEARLRAIVEGAADAIVTIDESGLIHAFNPAAARLFGYALSETIGQSVDLLFHEPIRLRPEEPSAHAIGHERTGRRKDGSLFSMEITISESADEGDRLLMMFLRDLTDRRHAETQMRKLRADRLDLMAQVAASVAHEINQPLSAIATYLSAARRLLQRRGPPPQSGPDASPDVESILDNAVAQVMRAGQIIGHLRGFVARAEPDKTLQSLHGLIKDACALAESDQTNSKVLVTLDLGAASDRVIVDRALMRQVIANLKRNALEAMQEAATRELVIATRVVDGGMIRVDISDTGAGLSAEVGSLLFEPFITTKIHGLGMGLAVSRSIVEAHYGNLWAEANPGGGAVLSFTLPLAGEHSGERLADDA